MNLERDLLGGGTARLLYLTYHFAVWPLGTFITGFERLGLIWSAIGAVPMFAVAYRADRKRQEKAANKPKSALGTSMIHSLGRQPTTEKTITQVDSALSGIASVLINMLGLYYAGAAIAYLWTWLQVGS